MEEGYKDIKDREVEKKTGKTFDKWIDVLGDEGEDPDAIVKNATFLQKKYSLTPWWARVVAVRYEWEEGDN